MYRFIRCVNSDCTIRCIKDITVRQCSLSAASTLSLSSPSYSHKPDMTQHKQVLDGLRESQSECPVADDEGSLLCCYSVPERENSTNCHCSSSSCSCLSLIEFDLLPSTFTVACAPFTRGLMDEAIYSCASGNERKIPLSVQVMHKTGRQALFISCIHFSNCRDCSAFL